MNSTLLSYIVIIAISLLDISNFLYVLIDVNRWSPVNIAISLSDLTICYICFLVSFFNSLLSTKNPINIRFYSISYLSKLS